MRTANYNMFIKQINVPFETFEPKLNFQTLLAMQETEQIIENYKNGLRTPKLFANASEMFAAMDLEDEAEDCARDYNE